MQDPTQIKKEDVSSSSSSSASPYGEQSIAVIGLGSYYPGSTGPLGMWENVLARRREFRRILDQRLPLNEYGSPDRTSPDKTYGTKAAYIDGFNFDAEKYKIAKQAIDNSDIVHWLALHVADMALADAGYSRDQLKKDPAKGKAGSRTGVIVGNTLTGEVVRAKGIGMRWPFVRKALVKAAQTRGLSQVETEELAATMEGLFKSVLPPSTEDTLAGSLSNTIAGVICNYFGLHGGGYTVDGACASSLLAVTLACNYLNNEDMDMVVVGGVDVSLDTMELIGFAKAGALTVSDMTVYDKDASGFIPGEGCGFVVLKRYADAVKAGDYIYGTVEGWGIATDGKGSLMTPDSDGQSMAISRAYARAPYSMKDIHWVEGHGTGTAAGDPIELTAIYKALGPEAAARSVGVTSFKSLVGHTKAASGIGAFLKTIMAVNRRVLPPSAQLRNPNPIFNKLPSVYPITQGRKAAPTERLRAGVSGMGFGGINCHVTVQSSDFAPRASLEPSVSEEALLVSNQYTEVFVVGSNSTSALQFKMGTLAETASHISEGDMVDLSQHLLKSLQANEVVRATVVAGYPADLADKLRQAAASLKESPLAEGEVRVVQPGVILGNNCRAPKIGFLFPGQGSQQINAARVLTVRHDWAKEMIVDMDKLEPTLSYKLYKNTDQAVNKEQLEDWSKQLSDTTVAQPTICAASLIWYNKLAKLGVHPTAVGGHSLGELASFCAGGYYDQATAVKLAYHRAQCMAAPPAASSSEGFKPTDGGAMTSLRASKDEVTALLQEAVLSKYENVVIANINADEQTVISGASEGIAKVEALAKKKDVKFKRLPVSKAFHSRFVVDASEKFGNVLSEINTISNQPAPRPAPPTNSLAKSSSTHVVKVFSGADTRGPTHELEGFDLRSHLKEQIVRQVDFISLVRNIRNEVDLLIEVGPGRVLSGLAESILSNAIPCLPVESTPGNDRDYNLVLAHLLVRNLNINSEELFSNRLVRPFRAMNERKWIVSPCELPMSLPKSLASKALVRKDGALGGSEQSNGWLSQVLSPEQVQFLPSYLKLRKDFLAAMIAADMSSQLVSNNLGAAGDSDALQQTTPSHPQVNVQAIVPAVQREDETQEGSSAAVQQSDASAAGGNVEELLLDTAREITGFQMISLKDELLEDLNVDSIKKARLISEAVRKLGLTGVVNPTADVFATLTTLGQIAQELRKRKDVSGSVSASKGPKSLFATRHEELGHAFSFVAKRMPRPLKADVFVGLEDVSEASLLLLAPSKEGKERQFATHLLAKAKAKGIAARLQQLGEPVGASAEAPAVKQIVAFLPQHSVAIDDLQGLQDMMQQMLADFIQVWNASADTCTRVVVVQFTHNGRQVDSCYASLGATMVLEKEGAISLSVVTLSSGLPNKDAVVNDLVVDGLIEETLNRQAQQFDKVYYSEDGTRNVYRMVPAILPIQPKRSTELNENDVIIVTGGAKGITANCAAELARATGAKMALLGRSSIEDKEVQDTLEKFKQEGLRGTYFQCDVASLADVTKTWQEIASKLGPVTALLHGAAVNKPCAFDKLDAKENVVEAYPKVTGLQNLLLSSLVNGKSTLRLIINLSSVIAVTGMYKCAVYGFSNEIMESLSEVFTLAHPETDVVSIQYTLWNDVGMGVRLGSFMEGLGITALKVEEGCKALLLATQQKLPASSNRVVVISQSDAGLTTWLPSDLDAVFDFSQSLFSPTLPTKVQPGLNGMGHVVLSMETDGYMNDHVYNGSLLVPAVLYMEMMAQMVEIVAGKSLAKARSVTISNLQFKRAVTLPRRGDQTLRVIAELNPETGNMECEIRSEDGDYEWPAVVATFAVDWGEGRSLLSSLSSGNLLLRSNSLGSLGSSMGTSLPSPRPSKRDDLAALAKQQPLLIKPVHDLYDDRLLFHGPQFQRIAEIYDLFFDPQTTDGYVIATIDFNATSSFRGGLSVMGDPFFRDNILQLGQLIIPQRICLPFALDNIKVYREARTTPGTKRIVRLDMHLGENEASQRSTIIVCDLEGNVMEEWTGYRISVLRIDPSRPDWTDLKSPSARDQKLFDEQMRYWKHLLCVESDEAMWALRSGVNFHQLGKPERHRIETEMVQEMMAQHNAKPKVASQLTWAESGKPELVLEKDEGKQSQEWKRFVSISHSDRVCVCVVDSEPVGCDLAEVDKSRTVEDWLNIFGETGENREARGSKHRALHQLVANGDTPAVAGSRIWAALESVYKLAPIGGDNVAVEYVTMYGKGNVLLLWDKRKPKRMRSLQKNSPKQEDDDSQWLVLTFQTSLTVGPDLVFAQTAKWEAPFSCGLPKFFNSFQLGFAVLPPRDFTVYPTFKIRNKVTWLEATTPIFHAVHHHYLIYMIGRSRNYALSICPEVAEEVTDIFASAEKSAVTNHVEMEVYDLVNFGYILQSNLWVEEYSQHDVVLALAFYKVHELYPKKKNKTLVAKAKIKVSCMKIKTQGFESVPWPEMFYKYCVDMAPRGDELEVNYARMRNRFIASDDNEEEQYVVPSQQLTETEEKGKEKDVSKGSTSSAIDKSTSPAKPRKVRKLDHGLSQPLVENVDDRVPVLEEIRFETSTLDSNLVGNIYYGAYSGWQSKVIDKFLFRLAPILYKREGDREVHFAKSYIQHLREAMPFDTVIVRLHLKTLFQEGMDVVVKFYHYLPEYDKELLLAVTNIRLVCVHQRKVCNEPADYKTELKSWPDGVLAYFQPYASV